MTVFKDCDYAYVEFYVGMAKMVAYWHVKALGFELIAYRGPETGCPDVLSYLLRKGSINLVITSAATPSAWEVLSFVDRHGNGVKRIAYKVHDVQAAYDHAVSVGAIPIHEPQRLEDKRGHVWEATLKLFDRKEIVFYNGDDFKGELLPHFEKANLQGFEPDFENGFLNIDHIAYGLHVNEIERWCDGYFQKIFGGEIVQDIRPGDMITEYSGLLLRLLSSANHRLHNVFVEPQNRARPSQVQEYLEAYYGSGVQHMAFATDNIFESVLAMNKTGADFVQYPKAYYDMMREEGDVPADLIDKLESHNVLCAKDGDAYLFQTFTKPFGDRPTFFYEIIQRTNNFSGFALENITQLFKAVEREQERRLLGEA